MAKHRALGDDPSLKAISRNYVSDLQESAERGA